ncbi:hypothetical protein [Brevundimonas sp.]|uniref:hypothetical protein n=1 Tax=Brevundimonas sp. TaxID=1871086 RepID=UPI00391A8672
MTGSKMNASATKILAISAVCALLGACGARFAAPTDPSSPLSGRVQELVDANRTYPRWADFPAAPTNVPGASVIAGRVAGLDQTGDTLDRSVAAIDWTLLEDPDVWSASVRARTEGARMSVGTARTAAEVEAFAQSLRDRAEPPPPIR